MDWGDLQFFLAVARHGSLSQAARMTGVDHTTVGRRVSQLEAALGAKLFDRLPGGWRLNEAGETIRAIALDMEERADTVSRRIAGQDLTLAGPVRVTVPDTLGSRFLTGCLARFQAAHPAIMLEVLTGSRSFDLARREADLGVRLGSPGSGDLMTRRVAEVGFGVYASRSYLARRGIDPAAPLDWRTIDAIGFDDSMMPGTYARWLAERLEGRTPVLATNRVPVQLAALAAGMGVAVVPCFAVSADPEIVRLLGPDTVARRGVFLVFHRDLARLARMRALIDFLVEAFAEARDLMAG
jgi:DNA-binding transcriptional LysR family regulator